MSKGNNVKVRFPVHLAVYVKGLGLAPYCRPAKLPRLWSYTRHKNDLVLLDKNICRWCTRKYERELRKVDRVVM